MTLVTALIRPHMEARVIRALHELKDCPGFTLTEARGQGRGRGAGGTYQASDSGLLYQRHLCLQVVCASPRAVELCRVVVAAAWTGHKGDGVIFTMDVGSTFARIRESGAAGPRFP
jgi:nitrogen regulatory protein PII